MTSIYLKVKSIIFFSNFLPPAAVMDARGDETSEAAAVARVAARLAPSDYLCPITYEIMVDPVFTVDGETYERSAIARWFAQEKNTSPRTNQPLAHTVLTSNRTLLRAIAQWRDVHGVPVPAEQKATAAAAAAVSAVDDAVRVAALRAVQERTIMRQVEALPAVVMMEGRARDDAAAARGLMTPVLASLTPHTIPVGTSHIIEAKGANFSSTTNFFAVTQDLVDASGHHRRKMLQTWRGDDTTRCMLEVHGIDAGTYHLYASNDHTSLSNLLLFSVVRGASDGVVDVARPYGGAELRALMGLPHSESGSEDHPSEFPPSDFEPDIGEESTEADAIVQEEMSQSWGRHDAIAQETVQLEGEEMDELSFDNDLVNALSHSPHPLLAREVARLIGREGRHSVNPRLYALEDAGRILSDGAVPPRWWTVAAAAARSGPSVRQAARRSAERAARE